MELINKQELWCDIMMLPHNGDIISSEEVEQAIIEARVIDAVSKGLYDQIKWERDIALEQLEELGLSLGQKIDGVYLSKEEYNRLLECADKRYKYGKNLFVNTQFR